MPVAWKESVVVPIYKKGDKTDCTMYKLLSNILLSKKLLRIISVDFVATGQLLIIYSSFVKYVKKKNLGIQCSSTSATYRLQTYNSFRRKVLYNILIEFGAP